MILDTVFDGTVGITKTESEQGVGFTITGEAGAWYEITETNCTVNGATSGLLGDLGTTLSVSGITTGNVSLSVTQRDLAGTTGPAGWDTVPADLTAPNPPVVSNDEGSLTKMPNPTWIWVQDGSIPGIGIFRYSLDGGAWSAETTAYSYTTNLTHGSHTLDVQEKNGVGNWSDSGSASIEVDLVAPSEPTVTGDQYTDDKTPTWNWSSHATVPGNGTFRYSLDGGAWQPDDNGDTSTSYTPGTDLTENAHTLSVQERDDAGNWSVSGSYIITVDSTAPAAPAVGGPRYTNDNRPTWTWTSGGDTATGGSVSGASGWYKYKLDSKPWSAETENTSYRPGAPDALSANADHILLVQEKDRAGNWSASDSYTITVDTTDPAAPAVDGPATTAGTPTTDRTPTWTWSSNGDTGTPGPGVSGASGSYRYNIDGAAWSADTTAETYTPGTLLNDGSPTLNVQERDNAGNWSDSGSFEVFIDGAPNAPIVNGVSPTTGTIATWIWGSGGNDGSGNYIYKLDSGSWSAETTAESYTPGGLSLGAHTLYVQERDANNNWSASGSRILMIIAP